MRDFWTGRDDAKYYATTVIMAQHMAPEYRAEYVARALGLLTGAVLGDAASRGACRDTDVMAAKRLRAWAWGVVGG